MYNTCPKCEYTRQPTDTGDADVCPGCGLIFSKYIHHRFAPDEDQATPAIAPGELASSWLNELRAAMFGVPPGTNTFVVLGRFVLWVLFVLWGLKFINAGLDFEIIGGSFMHQVNLTFHEAGHVIFSPFGEFMMLLGGSIGQLLMPLIVMIALIHQNRDPFGASLGLWWLGQSLIDLGPYIADARALELPLLSRAHGPEKALSHDWHQILLDLGMLDADRAIANNVQHFGDLLMLAAFAWGGYMLVQQYRTRE